MAQQRMTACYFCSLIHDTSTIGAHLDTFIPEVARAKRTTLQSCPLHPVPLIRAIRSESKRLRIVIPWKHPSKPTRFVHSLYGRLIAAASDEDLIADAGYRTDLGDVDGEWWMTHVDSVLEAYAAGDADKREVKRRIQRDIAEAGKLLREGITAGPTPERKSQPSMGPAGIMSPVYVLTGNKECAISFAGKDNARTARDGNKADGNASIYDQRSRHGHGGRSTVAGQRAARPAESSGEGARRESWERDSPIADADDENDDYDPPESPCLRAQRTRDKGKSKAQVNIDSDDDAEPALPAPVAAPVMLAAAPQSKRTARVAAAKTLRTKKRTRSQAPIETIILSSSPARVQTPLPTLTLRISLLGEPRVAVSVHREMTLADVLDQVWKSAPPAARAARPATAIFSDDGRWSGAWDEAIWRCVLAAAGVAEAPPVWKAKVRYVGA